MRGQVLGVDTRSGDGVITGDDGRRYRFRPKDWAHRGEPAIGMEVDFETEHDRATAIFPVPVAPPPAVQAGSVPAHAGVHGGRDRYVAAILAFLLGPLGIHRFYLGRTGSAIAMLVLSITVIGLVVSVPWALIDMVRYLVMSEREFGARYPRE